MAGSLNATWVAASRRGIKRQNKWGQFSMNALRSTGVRFLAIFRRSSLGSVKILITEATFGMNPECTKDVVRRDFV